MNIYRADGITLGVKEFTRTVTTPDGKKERVTYHEGDPEFDAYVETQRKQLEPALPIDFVSFGQGKSGAHGWQLKGQIRDKFDQYYAGEADMKDLERTISDVVSDLRSNYADQGFDPDEFMEDLLLDVYNVARASVITGAYNQGWLDSRSLAAQYNGHDGNTKDTIYYDAKYYYQSEDMKAALPEMFQRIGQRFGVPDLEVPTKYPDGSLLEEMYTSYNTYVNWSARWNFGPVGNMLDEGMVPPKDFKFFYKGNDSCSNIYPSTLPPEGSPGPDVDDGVLHVWYGDWSFVTRVPVRQNAKEYDAIVNMYDVISRHCRDIPEEIVPMLKNFDFFSCIQSGPYLKTHPRKLPS